MTKRSKPPVPSADVDEGKRDFLRKASYSAPVIMTLGAAAHSRKAMAQFTGPPSAPAPNSVAPEDDPLLEAIEEENSRG